MEPTKTVKPPIKQKNLDLWVRVCETYVNYPGISLRCIGEMCGTSGTHANRIIRAYRGKGNRIITVPSKVFT